MRHKGRPIFLVAPESVEFLWADVVGEAGASRPLSRHAEEVRLPVAPGLWPRLTEVARVWCSPVERPQVWGWQREAESSLANIGVIIPGGVSVQDIRDRIENIETPYRENK